MNLTATRTSANTPLQAFKKMRVRSGGVYSAIIVLALIAFEAVNYSTTAYALRDLLGDLKFAGISWATLMALAFCSLDFAGIARLVTQKTRAEESRESWFLFGAWLIAATFNAALTWWGVTIAIANHSLRSAEVVSTQHLTTIVPLLVAIMVWVIRILIIGSLTSALERSSHQKTSPSTSSRSTSPAGFPVNNRPAPGYGRPQTATPTSQATVSRTSMNSMARSNPSRSYQPLKTNDFMAAEQQGSRDL
jgi:hypothetical protein